MSLDTVFQNLTPEELQRASEWLRHLREAEIPRVQETLKALNELDFYFGWPRQRARFATIVAGSSIDTRDYTDIDLFLLADTELDQEGVSKHGLNGRLMDQLNKLPELAYYLEYGPVTAGLMADKRDMFERGLGAMVTVSLLYSLTGFGIRRPSHNDDLLEPEKFMKAEQLIKFNREQGSKFLVLNRQYTI